MANTYNVIRHNESDTQEAESIWGASHVDESQAPDYGGTATVEDLQKTYQGSTLLQQTFGSFENYLGYMTEANEMLGQQDWWNAEGIDKRSPSEVLREGEDLAVSTTQPVNDFRQSNYNARQSQYQQWLMSDENQALMEKYGIAPRITNEKGDKFHWTGSGYVRTYKENRSQGADIAKAIMVGIASFGVGQLAAGAMLGTAGAGGAGAAGATGATTAGATGATTAATGSSLASSIGGALGLKAGTVSAATGAMVGSATGQYIMTGSIDPKKILISGITAGIVDTANVLQNMDPALADSATLGFLDDKVNQLSELLNVDYDTALNIAEGVSIGLIEGGDLEGIVKSAVATVGADFVTDTIQNTVGTTVPNFFEPGTTTINPDAIEEASRIFLRDGLNGELDAGTLFSAGLGYYRNDGTFAFMDPSSLFPEFDASDFFDFLPDLPDLPDFGLPDVDLMSGEGFDIFYELAATGEGTGNIVLQYDQDTVDQIQQLIADARQAGRDLDDAVFQPIFDTIREAGYVIDDNVLQPIKRGVEALWDMVPEVNIPFPDIKMPSISGPDVSGPDADFPSADIGLPKGEFRGSKPFGEDLKQFSPLGAPQLAQEIPLLQRVNTGGYDPRRAGSPIVQSLFAEYLG